LYLQAEDTDSVERLEEVFTADAEVRDEGQVIRGLADIGAWKRAAKARYRYRVQPLAAREQAGTWHLRVRVAGDFPGSSVELAYTIALEGGRSARLRIGRKRSGNPRQGRRLAHQEVQQFRHRCIGRLEQVAGAAARLPQHRQLLAEG